MDMEEVATPTCEASQTREVRNSLGLGTAGVSEDKAMREKEAETEDAAEKRVFEFFRDQLRIKKELDKQIGGTTRLINEWAPGGDGSIQIGGERSQLLSEMALIDARDMSEEQRMKYLEERVQRATEKRVAEGKANVVRMEEAARAQRRADMWVEGKPTEMAYLIAQAIAHISSYYHPDPDNPPTVKGFVAEIETTDDIPVRARARKFADIQKAYLRAMTKALIRQGKLEVSTGEYASGLVLVPYHDRIRAFMDKWGEAAQSEMWKEEHEAEVATFYRCTCDYRALNLKSKSDVFPLPRIDDLLDQIPRGTCHFSSGDVQDAFWTVKLAE
jgi:hypothetical protein